jgi:hypothetical protein
MCPNTATGTFLHLTDDVESRFLPGMHCTLLFTMSCCFIQTGTCILNTMSTILRCLDILLSSSRYILASKPDQYVFVYYRGQNDAWKGYGGATVYTRAASLPEEYVPELRAAAESAGLDWSQFKLTDNSCPAKPPARGPFEELEADLEQAERFASKEVNEIEKTLEPKLESFGRGFTVIAKEVEDVADEVAKGIEQEERLVADAARQEAKAAERLIRRFEMEAKMGLMGKWVQKLPLSVREFIMPMPMP